MRPRPPSSRRRRRGRALTTLVALVAAAATSAAQPRPVPLPAPTPAPGPTPTPAPVPDTEPHNWSFEGGLRSWTVLEGNAFAAQPVRGHNVTAVRAQPPGMNLAELNRLGGDYWETFFPIGHRGAYWIGTYDKRGATTGETQGDAPTGILASAAFTIRTNVIGLLLSGGQDPGMTGDGPAGDSPPPGVAITAARLGVVLQVWRAGAWRDVRWATGRNREIFDRVAWKVGDLKGQVARLLIVDRRDDGWGHVNVDDIRFADTLPLVTYDFGSVRYTREERHDEAPAVWGYADAHLHLMAHLGFGGRMLAGEPTGPLKCDGHAHGGTVTEIKVKGRPVKLPISSKLVQVIEGAPMGKDTDKAIARIVLDVLGVNDGVTLYALAQALALKVQSTPAWWIANGGVPLPPLVLGPLEGSIAGAFALHDLDQARAAWAGARTHVDRGAPDYPRSQPSQRLTQRGAERDNPLTEGWPNNFTRLHQQAHISWLRRAHQGGLRTVVMMIGHADIFSDVQGNKQDVGDAMRKQIAATRALVAANGDVLALVTSAAEARRAVGQGKLALVLGIEVGSIDRLLDLRRPDPYADLADRLWKDGIRHVYAIHNTDNTFGGTAINGDLFNLNNLYLNKHLFKVRDGSGEGVRPSRKWFPSALGDLQIDVAGTPVPLYGLVLAAAREFLPIQINQWTVDRRTLDDFVDVLPEYLRTPAQVNARGLSTDGERMIHALMDRGFVIDIDHSSFLTRDKIFAMARRVEGGYPLTSSHTDVFSVHDDPNEGMLRDRELTAIRELGGTVSPVWSILGEVKDPSARGCQHSSTSFLVAWRAASTLMGGRGMPIGSDMNGFLQVPHARFGRNHCLPATALPVPATTMAQTGAVRYAHYPAGATVTSADLSVHPVGRLKDGVSSKQIPLGANRPLVAHAEGGRIFDVNVDGPVHVGLVPDFLQDVANQAPDRQRVLMPMFTGASAYIDMLALGERAAAWRRANPGRR
ncbi:MAG: membrane dipeptidase [Kofleriaceae bacterium]|nr:membrane dipeptidase [Kofleriaceae bacterium]MCL4224999.1 membrane dipeptidase [Myxococcales bacterium]